ncbi:hypothetical protein P154DRAFT_520501 [Amniculicola lignicola CBS 123094]|uniref:Uncharacterized protein n=1 Tax=Amniculicola lignicola CBS 123094 TaxID=1392246 RepID=A0A6A5WQU3_9PLEO|nr:hypothetical protein P154DRAFT_520501 [Amniculicola lignicola CBS 123094]
MVTLSFVTISLVALSLPLDITAFVPLLPRLRFDPSTICGDLQSEGEWLGRCEGEFFIIKVVVMLVVGLLVVAQWWAAVNVWWWARGLERREVKTDVEKNKRQEDCKKEQGIAWESGEEKSRI